MEKISISEKMAAGKGATLKGEVKQEKQFGAMCMRTAKPVEPRCYRKSIHGYLAKAGAHDVNPHMLRHTFATTCLQAGCDIKTLSELMGHSNPNITLQRYVHTNMDRKRFAIEQTFGNE